jgi:pimeloyl-ACP methyl ester carboxylesterase
MVDQKSIFLHEGGNPQGETILFLHGSPLSGRMWEPNFKDLKEFHCLAPDLPGHGQSSHIGALPTNELVKLLAEIIQAHSKDKTAHVVGLSYGGVIAQALISDRPDLIKRVILSGTSAKISPFMQAVFRIYIGLNKPILRLFSAGFIGKLISIQFGIPKQYLSTLTEDMKRVDPDVMADCLLSSYMDVQTPIHTDKEVLVIAGENETPFAKTMARRLTRQIPSAVGIFIPNAGHVWNLQKPDLFARVVRWWFSGESIDMDWIQPIS